LALGKGLSIVAFEDSFGVSQELLAEGIILPGSGTYVLF
jgi:hypothetical protein